MDRALQDAEAAERIAGLMEDDARNQALYLAIAYAVNTLADMHKEGAENWPNSNRIIGLADSLHAYYVNIARLMGITVHEAQSMVEGTNFQAAELAALRIGRGVLARLGYQLPGQEPDAPGDGGGKDRPTMNDWIDSACDDAIARKKAEAQEQARSEAERQAAEARKCSEALRRILDSWGVPPWVDFSSCPFATVRAWCSSSVGGREQWQVILTDSANNNATHHEDSVHGKESFALRLRDLRAEYNRRQ